MDSTRDIVLQEMNEERYNRKHIDAKIRKAIESSFITKHQIEHGVELINTYKAAIDKYHPSKQARIRQLDNMDVPEMVQDMFIGIAYFQQPELFTSVAAQITARLRLSDKVDAITTVAEMLAVLADTDAFDITKDSKMASLKLQSRIPLGERLVKFIECSEFLPPMLCSPLELTHNYSSGYLTHNDSLILGNGNHHDGDICLDVLNIMNSVPLQLSTEFLCKVEEEPTFDLDTTEKVQQWNQFKAQSYEFYLMLAEQGNKFYFTHKVDKRGRIYAHGYHLNPQGTAFKKAMLEFADEEVVSGVPASALRLCPA
jgi:hypothetical protein